MSVLEAKNVSYFYQDGGEKRYVLDGVSAELKRGVFYTILGESGSGKTTLLSLLSALDVPTKGQILYEGKDLQGIGHDSYRRNCMGMIFQAYNLIPYMTGLENVSLAMSVTENDLTNQVAYEVLEQIGITKEKANRTVNKLSGGEQQRVAIARALSTNVSLILADEPTGNLNEERADEVVDIFKKLAHEHDKCVVVVTHSKSIAKCSDVILILKNGKLSVEKL